MEEFSSFSDNLKTYTKENNIGTSKTANALYLRLKKGSKLEYVAYIRFTKININNQDKKLVYDFLKNKIPEIKYDENAIKARIKKVNTIFLIGALCAALIFIVLSFDKLINIIKMLVAAFGN